MGGKHLKRLRAEKSKVKLKKKSLPKGQNITDTTFKVKKIVTVEQLKKVDENEPVTSWNLSLKDLLIRLGHYNQSSKLNSLSGIKELVTNHPEILKGPSLTVLITRVLELLCDEEPRVRKNAVDLIEYLFDCLPATSIVPFHDILNVHLGCAMTHRNSAIQRDSLKLIDVMIKHTPQAVRHNFKSLLQNFIRIIKSYLYRSSSDLLPTETNLEKSRCEMLLRFYQILSTVYSVQMDEPLIVRTLNVNNNEQISLRGLNNFYKKIPDLSALFKSDGTKNGISSEFDADEYRHQCALIMPLLFDSWLESCPDQKSKKFMTECLIHKPVAELLTIVLKIIMILYDKAATNRHQNLESWFVSSYGQTFKKCFLFGFPFLPSVSPEKLDGNLPAEFPYKKFSGYLMQNLIVCYLAYSLKVVQNNILSGKMENYISSVLTAKNPTEIYILSKVVEAVFKSSKRSGLLSAAIQAYNESSSPELRKMLSKVLTAVMLEKENLCQDDENMFQWMTLLPEELLKPYVCLHIIEGILTAIKRPTGSLILEKVEEKAEEIFKNLPHIKVEGIDQLQGQKLIADILYWCNKQILTKIQNVLLEVSSLPPDVKTYMMNILSYKLSVNF